MATELVPKKQWGLGRCSVENCPICTDYTITRATQIRDLYSEGVEVWVIEKCLDIPKGGLFPHARRKGWTRKRRKINNNAMRAQATMLTLKRLEDFYETGSDSTADKMLELYAKLSGAIGGGINIGVNVNNNNAKDEMSWEERVYRRQGGGIIEGEFSKKEEEEEGEG